MIEPIFINAGRSDQGWSFWGPSFACDQLWFLLTVEQRQFIGADALVQGSMGHVALAHHYARLAAGNGGLFHEGEFINDPERFLHPHEAVERWAREAEGRGEDALCFVANTKQLLHQYTVREPYFNEKVIGVEMSGKLTIGYNHDGVFGLWIDDNLAVPLLLDCPDLEEPHPNVPQLQHRKPIVITKRMDLVVQAAHNGMVYIWDHKVTGGSVGKTVAEKYAMDGQFAVNRILGQQLWEDFGGVVLNLVQRRDPWAVGRHYIEESPRRDRMFAYHLWEKALHLADKLAIHKTGRINRDHWAMTQTDLLCYHRFGKCGAYDLCRLEGE